MAALPPGAVVLCCTTVAPEAARLLGGRVVASGQLYLDAPVSGGAVGARAGKMSVMASGSPEAFAAAEPILSAIAAKVWRLGDAPGVGSTVKMVNQLLAGVHIAAAAEAMALGIRAGADPQTLFDVISGSAGSSWMWQNRMPHVLAGDDTPLSSVNIFVKDLGIVLDQARALTFPLPMASAAHQLFLAASAAGHGGARRRLRYPVLAVADRHRPARRPGKRALTQDHLSLSRPSTGEGEEPTCPQGEGDTSAASTPAANANSAASPRVGPTSINPAGASPGSVAR